MWELIKFTDGSSWYYVISDFVRDCHKVIAYDLSETEEDQIMGAFTAGEDPRSFDREPYVAWDRGARGYEEFSVPGGIMYMAIRDYTDKELEESTEEILCKSLFDGRF